MHLSTHLSRMAQASKVKDPIKKLYSFAQEICVMKNQQIERPESNRGAWLKTKEIFKFYDGSAIGFFFEKGEPSRAEDYGAIVSK